jgi:hypothetical protein
MTAEIVRGMAAADYHAHPAVGSTGLRAALKTPRRFKAMRAGELRVTPAQKLGTPIHCAWLEPDRWATEYVVAPRRADGNKLDRRYKEDKAAWAAFAAANKGKEVLEADEYDLACRIGDALRAHPDVAELMASKRHVERSHFWSDAETGIQCKCRPDVECDVALVDLKSTSDAGPSQFARSVANYGYHLQAAHYLWGVTGGHPLDTTRPFYFIAIEKTPPYEAAVYELDRSAIAQGWALVRRALHVIAVCQANSDWPSYRGIKTLGLPAWASEQVEEEAAQ